MTKNKFTMLLKLMMVFALVWYLPKEAQLNAIVVPAGNVYNGDNALVSNPKGKEIYIYNTHQAEKYQDYDVVAGAKYLQEKLIQRGYGCMVENNDFEAYKNQNSISYDYSYTVSKLFLEQNLLNGGNYDLLIDFHRDALTKEASTLQYDGKSYAKILFVVGEGSDNYESVKALSTSLSNLLETQVPGISRGLMHKQSHYNQDTTSNMILLEFGGDKNTKEEVQNSIEVVAKCIDQYLGGL